MTRIKHNGMVVDTFGAAKGASGRSCVFLNGFPGAIGPLPGVLAATSRGWNVVFPQYPGTYDSDGVFDVSAASEAVSALLPEIHQLSGFEAPSSIIAHSFGAFIATSLFRADPGCSIRSALFLAPVFSYERQPDSGVREVLLPHLEETISERPYTYRLGSKSEWATIARGEQPVPRVGSWTGIARIVIGDDDDTFETDVAVDRLPLLFESLTGCHDVRTELIRGAGHGMDELTIGSTFLDEVLS